SPEGPRRCAQERRGAGASTPSLVRLRRRRAVLRVLRVLSRCAVRVRGEGGARGGVPALALRLLPPGSGARLQLAAEAAQSRRLPASVLSRASGSIAVAPSSKIQKSRPMTGTATLN